MQLDQAMQARRSFQEVVLAIGGSLPAALGGIQWGSEAKGKRKRKGEVEVEVEVEVDGQDGVNGPSSLPAWVLRSCSQQAQLLSHQLKEATKNANGGVSQDEMDVIVSPGSAVSSRCLDHDLGHWR